MSLSSLSANTYTNYSDRYRSRRQGVFSTAGAAPSDEAASSSQTEPIPPEDLPDFEAPTWASAPAGETASYASKFKADLSRLASVEPWRDEPSAETSPASDDFLGNLSTLLASVRTGDAARARVAAIALQYELASAPAAQVAPPNPVTDGPTRLLDDFKALIRAARLGDTGGARSAAQNLASDIQSALTETGAHWISRSPSLGHGATAAYETLMELTQASANSPV